MPAAQRELRGGARQQSRFNNCGEGGCGVLSLSDFRLARSQSLSLGVAGSRIYSRWRAGSCPSLRPRRRRFLFAVMGWWPALLVCAIDGGAGGQLPGHGDRRPRDRSAVRAIRYPACVRSQISGWRDRGLYPLARVAAEESGAGLGWRRRWWGDGAMAAPALSCRVGRERELDRSCAGGVRCWREQAHVGLNRPRPHVGQAGGGLVQRVGAFRRRSVPTCSGLIV